MFYTLSKLSHLQFVSSGLKFLRLSNVLDREYFLGENKKERQKSYITEDYIQFITFNLTFIF